jgi:uncharacterized membrane protein
MQILLRVGHLNSLLAKFLQDGKIEVALDAKVAPVSAQLRVAIGKRPVYGGTKKFQDDPQEDLTPTTISDKRIAIAVAVHAAIAALATHR